MIRRPLASGAFTALVAIAAAAHAASAAAAIAPAADTPAPAPPGSPAWAESADVVEHLGDRLPLELAFTDARSRRVALGSLFDGEHPVLLVLAYYECPQLCSLVLDGAAAAMRQLEPQGWQPGRQYRVATISFDATERVDQAQRKQAGVLDKLGLAGRDAAAWPFWVGDDASIRALTGALGFGFLRDPATGALAHPAVAFVLTPDGRIARYLYGIDYPPRDLKLALLEASAGRTGSLGDRILMRCFRYDPATRRYGMFVARFMQVGGAATLAIVVALIAGFARYELRRRGAHAP